MITATVHNISSCLRMACLHLLLKQIHCLNSHSIYHGGQRPSLTPVVHLHHLWSCYGIWCAKEIIPCTHHQLQSLHCQNEIHGLSLTTILSFHMPNSNGLIIRKMMPWKIKWKINILSLSTQTWDWKSPFDALGLGNWFYPHRLKWHFLNQKWDH